MSQNFYRKKNKMLDILNQIDLKYTKISQGLICKRSLSENICVQEILDLLKSQTPKF